MGVNVDTAVENDDALERGTEVEDAESLVVLLLFAHKEETHLSVVQDIKYLLLAVSGIEGDAHGTHAIGTEVGVEILHAVLREYGYIFLRLHAQIKESITHLLNSQRKLVPRDGLPLVVTKILEGEGRTPAVLLGKIMD